ncbi:hypothetical protein KVV02_001859 [Mortierella alpina]|uniref:THO complex subunit 1 n=1 Tax=Mortierella alpina TaxID=64518 RepID=A0A9P8A1Z8_MORAP|nr:hypothetical protein KVV02_001859 [Mortierella alpina]
MLSLPPFKPMLATAEAITSILEETKGSASVNGAASHTNTFSKDRTTVFDTPIQTMLQPTLDQYKALDSMALLESAFKLKLITIQDKLGTRIVELKDAIFRCLDLLLRCSELELVDQSSPLNYIEELLDYQTVESSEHIYDYLESRVDRLTVNMIAGRGKGLTMLRLCNELLRRLSKAKNTVFCGRILILLSSVFPLTERSGVNLRGDFNTENVTLVENEDVTIVPELTSTPQQPQKDEGSQGSAAESMEVDNDQRKSETSKKESAFYTEFWGLQAFFSNPATLVNSRENMDKLQQGMEHALAKFTEVKEAEQRSRGQRLKELTKGPKSAESSEAEPYATLNGTVKGVKRKHSHHKESDAAPTAYFPKFLTSPKLLQLEMADPYFRKHILIQFLIIIQYLQDHNASAKEAYAKIPNPNKSFQPQWVLEDKDQEWAEALKPKIYAELKEIGLESGDARYLNTINFVLDDEESWVQWKAENCQAFERPSLTAADLETARQKRQKLSDQVSSRSSLKLGCMALHKVWTQAAGGNVQSAGFGRKISPPSLSGFLQRRPVDASDNEAFAGLDSAEREKRAKDEKEAFFWRALRLGTRQYMHVYDKHSVSLDYNLDKLEKDFARDVEFETWISEHEGKLPPPDVLKAIYDDKSTTEAPATITGEQATGKASQGEGSGTLNDQGEELSEEKRGNDAEDQYGHDVEMNEADAQNGITLDDDTAAATPAADDATEATETDNSMEATEAVDAVEAAGKETDAGQESTIPKSSAGDQAVDTPMAATEAEADGAGRASEDRAPESSSSHRSARTASSQ